MIQHLNSPRYPRKPFFNEYATTRTMRNRILSNLTVSWYWYLHGIIDIYEFIEFRYGLFESYTYGRDKIDPFSKNNLSL